MSRELQCDWQYWRHVQFNHEQLFFQVRSTVNLVYSHNRHNCNVQIIELNLVLTTKQTIIFYVFAFCYVNSFEETVDQHFIDCITFFLDSNYTKEESVVRKYFHTLWQNRSCSLFAKKLVDLGISTLVSCTQICNILYQTRPFILPYRCMCGPVSFSAKFQWFRW